MSDPAFPSQRRPDRAVISITGDGVLTWLDNLITCDVEGLREGDAAYGALLSPHGKILDDMFVLNAGGRVLIDCAAVRQSALVQRLTMYRLRAKLAIAAEDEMGVEVHPTSPDTEFAYRDPRVADMGWRVMGAASASAKPGYEYHRVNMGLADSITDLGIEQTFPHEANFDQFGGVSFSKGCFVGQEVVSRMQHRGTARNRFLPVRIEGLVMAERKITSGDAMIGEIHSVVLDRALALVRIDRLAEAKAPLMAGTARVHVMTPSWITYDVFIPEVAR